MDKVFIIMAKSELYSGKIMLFIATSLALIVLAGYFLLRKKKE
jgi:LPXTG-motif cell wall-anchored protein